MSNFCVFCDFLDIPFNYKFTPSLLHIPFISQRIWLILISIYNEILEQCINVDRSRHSLIYISLFSHLEDLGTGRLCWFGHVEIMNGNDTVNYSK